MGYYRGLKCCSIGYYRGRSRSVTKLALNKSIFISIIPYEGESEKRVISNKPALTKLYSISLLVSITPRDFLGIFCGKLQYIN